MSGKLIGEAKLEGYEGPIAGWVGGYFHKSLDLARPFDGEVLGRAAETIKEHLEQFSPTTSDGYTWFWGHSFQVGSGKFAVLIPMFQDWEERDGTGADRAVAVYIQGDVGPNKILEVLSQFAQNIKEVRAKYYSNPEISLASA